VNASRVAGEFNSPDIPWHEHCYEQCPGELQKKQLPAVVCKTPV